MFFKQPTTNINEQKFLSSEECLKKLQEIKDCEKKISDLQAKQEKSQDIENLVKQQNLLVEEYNENLKKNSVRLTFGRGKLDLYKILSGCPVVTSYKA